MNHMAHITNVCSGRRTGFTLPESNNLRIYAGLGARFKLIALLQDAITSRWMGKLSIVYLISYIVFTLMLLPVNQVSMYLGVFGLGTVLSPAATAFVRSIVILLIAVYGHRQMACYIDRNETGLELDAFNYGMSAALSASLLCYIPSLAVYAQAHPVMCILAALLCAFCILITRYLSLDIGQILWSFRLNGPLPKLIVVVAIIQLLPTTIGMPARTELVVPEAKIERTLEFNMGSAASFFDGSWDDMSLQERVNILGDMAVVLTDYLGISKPPQQIVARTNMSSESLGYYDHSGAGTITVNAAYLMAEDPLVALNTISHEMAHVLQWEMLQIGKRPQESSYPYGVDEKKLQDYLVSYTGILPYEERITEREAFEFGGHFSRIVSKKVCAHLQIQDPFKKG